MSDRFRRVERGLAAVVAALPLAYLLTERSWSPVIWNYSATLVAAIVIYAVFYALLWASYGWRLPSLVEQLRSNAVVLAFGLLLAFLAADAGLAVIDDRPNVETKNLRGYAPDPDTGYVYIPNYEQDVVTLESATHWHSNSLGIRADRDYGPKPAGVVRILALGDSFTVNTAVEARDTWPGVLERLLAKSPSESTFEVVNGGHAGYGTSNMLWWYEKYALGLNPDMVLMAMTPNDITDNGNKQPGTLTAVDGYLASVGSTTLDRQRFEHRQRWYSLPGRLERSRLKALVSGALAANAQGPTLAACHINPDANEQRLFALTEDYLLKIRDLAARQGASFGLLLITFQEQLGEMAPGYSGTAFGERWTKFAREHGIAVVDTYPMLRKHSGQPPLYWRWDGHYTAEGSRVAGAAAFDLVSAIRSQAPAQH